MNQKVLKSVEEMFAENATVDNQSTFEKLWQITCEMFEKVNKRFELQQDPCCSDLLPYKGLDGEASGLLSTYTGPEVDWLVHSWTGNPKATFTNMHLTINLGQHIRVPNFGFALGTIPDLFVYMDYIPRIDYATDPDYIDQYYAGSPNETYLAMQADDEWKDFVSRDIYTRVSLTPNAFCYSAENKESNIDKLRELCHQQLDRWLAWVDAAEAVPVEERRALADRDELIRRTIAERDPANVVAEKLFGKELTDRLVATLWGGTRELPRPIDK